MAAASSKRDASLLRRAHARLTRWSRRAPDLGGPGRRDRGCQSTGGTPLSVRERSVAAPRAQARET
jgi:hypothetical protein